MAEKTIMIVGGSPHFEVVPHILNAEIWTIPSGLPIRRATRIFEVHDYIDPEKAKLINEANPDIVYMQGVSDILRNSVRFPIEAIVDRFGEMFTNSISYMIALAIIEYERGVRPMTIHLRRMHTVFSKEYIEQIPNIVYYIGWARGIGINVTVSEHSVLLKPKRLYAYKDYEYGGA